MDRKRTLVTGGPCFIGSHLCKRLLHMGHDMLAVDNFYSSDRHNVLDLLQDPRFELIRHDVTFPLYVEVEEIYHLACPASPVYYQRESGLEELLRKGMDAGRLRFTTSL